MKNYFVIGLLTFCSVNLIAQDEPAVSKNTLSVGLNWVSFEAPVKGASISGEYAFSINKYISIATSASGSTTLYHPEASFSSYSYLETSAFLRITPFANSFNRLKFDFGGFYQYMIETGGGLSNEQDAFSYYDIAYGSFAKHNHFGLMSGISLNIIQNKYYEFGIKAHSNWYPNWKLGTYSRNIGIYFRKNF